MTSRAPVAYPAANTVLCLESIAIFFCLDRACSVAIALV
jgi:hypothetical protein